MGHGPQQFGRLGSRCTNDVPRYGAPWPALHAPMHHACQCSPVKGHMHIYMCISGELMALYIYIF